MSLLLKHQRVVYCVLLRQVYRKKPSDFYRVNSFKLPPFIRVGDFKYVKEAARLGRLKGNRSGPLSAGRRCPH